MPKGVYERKKSSKGKRRPIVIPGMGVPVQTQPMPTPVTTDSPDLRAKVIEQEQMLKDMDYHVDQLQQQRDEAREQFMAACKITLKLLGKLIDED